jgi:hypothetical protein
MRSRTCSRCGVEKPIEAYSWDSSCRAGRRPDCKDCIKLVRAPYLAKNRVRIQRRTRANKYGITVEQMDELLAQGCAICGGPAADIDHDHGCCAPPKRACGTCVRAALCGPCNRGLGLYRDDPALLRAAADYLIQAKHLNQGDT